MRSLVVRALQAALVVLVAIAGYHAYRTQRDAPSEPVSLGRNLVLGPRGIAGLRLGMTVAEANATGHIRFSPASGADPCSILVTEGASFHFSRTYGLAVITAPREVRTPEGIGRGSTLSQLKTAYPKAHAVDIGSPDLPVRLAGSYAAAVPGNPSASYLFFTTGAGPTVDVAAIALDEQNRECTGLH